MENSPFGSVIWKLAMFDYRKHPQAIFHYSPNLYPTDINPIDRPIYHLICTNICHLVMTNIAMERSTIL